MNAVAYFRCSGSTQEKGDTWDRQREAVCNFAMSHGYHLECEFLEAAVPGKTDLEGRPQFQAMVSTLLANGCRTVIVETLDRLAREYRIQETLLIYLSTKGISLIAANTGENITEAMMGDPMRRALVQIQGIFAELEKNMLVAKMAKAKKRIREATGKPCGGRRSYTDTPSAVEIVNRIHFLRRNGYNASQITAVLNAEGFRTLKGTAFHPAQVNRILKAKRPS